MTHEVTVSDPRAFAVGDGPLRLSAPGALPAGLSGSSDYYVVAVHEDRLRIQRGWRAWWARLRTLACRIAAKVRP